MTSVQSKHLYIFLNELFLLASYDEFLYIAYFVVKTSVLQGISVLMLVCIG